MKTNESILHYSPQYPLGLGAHELVTSKAHGPDRSILLIESEQLMNEAYWPGNLFGER